jgi:thiamine biosynthesis protein ThiC
MLKPETIQALKEDGYDNIKEYLHDLADEYDVPYSVVVSLYNCVIRDLDDEGEIINLNQMYEIAWEGYKKMFIHKSK